MLFSVRAIANHCRLSFKTRHCHFIVLETGSPMGLTTLKPRLVPSGPGPVSPASPAPEPPAPWAPGPRLQQRRSHLASLTRLLLWLAASPRRRPLGRRWDLDNPGSSPIPRPLMASAAFPGPGLARGAPAGLSSAPHLPGEGAVRCRLRGSRAGRRSTAPLYFPASSSGTGANELKKRRHSSRVRTPVAGVGLFLLC